MPGPNPFAELRGTFEASDVSDDELDADNRFDREAITEQQIHEMYWRLVFTRVQYGTYEKEPACLVVVEARFHAEQPKRHRFTWASISAKFVGESEPVKVKKLVPELAHGIHVREQRKSQWAISLNPSATVAGVPITIELFDFSKNGYKKHDLDLVASMEGSKRGYPMAIEAFWTLNEAKQEGIPLRIPSMVMVLKCNPGSRFVASFNIEATVNASLNPTSWRPLRGVADPVPFDGVAELIAEGDETQRDFSKLDLSKLTKLDFADEKQ